MRLLLVRGTSCIRFFFRLSQFSNPNTLIRLVNLKTLYASGTTTSFHLVQ